jgi:tripartite-type tricarboxylate transporter receptor subunit TctC
MNTIEKRSPSLPDVPTTAEGGMLNFAVSGWYGLLAPAGTPRPSSSACTRRW